ncbi:ABC-ATPase domain-containing protein [Lusitaniella coriacea LEGE 07157]|uniref:ABC-ATPase domain-containing protein n=1 Tax=Lusitaniella coriacea LEGE 07157 TaxID=945747 RepID=A0A8J7B7K4_9CYAN|nr:ABC-ATPase domain-containing protein [Lusitaniella coriacea]MBE9115459.1 ABC-ATPase domain-containing protein [Lusitaniella coriacea LEGE 07157]
MLNHNELYARLLDLDGGGYKAYKGIRGSYQFPNFVLIIDRVQGDPFAAPSSMRVRVPHAVAQFSSQLYGSPSREIALRDYLTRQFGSVARTKSSHRGTGKSGKIAIASLGQTVLARNSVLIDGEGVEARFVVGLPARGRRILGRQAMEMLCEDIPEIVEESLRYPALNADEIQQHVEGVEDSEALRQSLVERKLVAFIADGAILPRRSGADDRPLEDCAIAFCSPPSLRVELERPNGGKISGMGIPEGITLILGGGYHGKSTLLRAIARGVYNHAWGDGREAVVTDPSTVKIRAEDGRSIAGTNITPFINHLPQNRSTQRFSTENASGSTSQAANIMEALEAGASVLLVDEDTAATNFTIRDRRMQELISKDKEPITPFIDKVRQLYRDCGVSTILVMGGSGDYFEVADRVIAMENYQPREVTAEAKEIARKYATGRLSEGGEEFGEITPRVPLPESVDPSRGRHSVKVKARDRDEVFFGTQEIDLAAVEQIVDAGQLRAIAAALVYAKGKYMDGKRTIPEILDRAIADIEEEGFDVLSDFPQGNFAQFRRFELAAALNRLRSLRVKF